MPAARDRKTNKSSSSRGRNGAASSRSGASGSRSRSRGRSAQSASARGSTRRGAAQSKATNAKNSNAKATSAKASNSKTSNSKTSNGTSQQDHVGREALTALLGATVGVAGGVLLGRTALAREHKVLGIPLPKKVDLGGVGQQIGEAGRQLGKLAGEVRGVREKAEQIGKALS